MLQICVCVFCFFVFAYVLRVTCFGMVCDVFYVLSSEMDVPSIIGSINV